MVTIEDWQARLILRIMNTAAFYYSEEVRKSAIMDDIEFLRETLERQAGTVSTPIDQYAIKTE
jgi:hypothetical protein